MVQRRLFLASVSKFSIRVLVTSLISNFFVGRILPNNYEDAQIDVEFSLYYPQNYSIEQVKNDFKALFPGERATLVDREFELHQLIIDRAYEFKADRFTHKITFRSRESYEMWEKCLKESTAYNSAEIKKRGYRFETKIS
jgi:hypothetical protein